MSHRADPAAARLADRHYSRQTVGSPQFMPSGSCCVFLTECGRAVWGTSWQKPEFVDHAWPDAWVNTIFRSEGAGLASELIAAAISATRAFYGKPPSRGMITMIDLEKVRPITVRSTKVWGWTYRKVGFKEVGETGSGKLVLQLLPEEMPPAIRAKPRSMHGAPLFDACG